MKTPQTTAIDLLKLKNLNSISKYGCLAFVVLWCLHLDPTDNEALRIVDDSIEKGVLEKDCKVHWADYLEYLTGKKFEIEFKDINSIKGITRRTPVLFTPNGNPEEAGHWVGVENGKIVFNPLKYSKNVAEGKPATSRIIKLNGKQI